MKTRLIRRISTVIGAILLLGAISAAPAMASNLKAKTRSSSVFLEKGSANAGLKGEVYLSAEAAVYTFEYGPTTEYESQTEIVELPEAAMGWWPVSATVKGLNPGTRYHYRLVAIDEDGAVVGGDDTFDTPPYYISESGKGTLSGSQDASNKLTFALPSNNNQQVSCVGATLAGKVPEGVNGVDRGSMKLSPSYSNCTAFGQSGTVTTNGCEYVMFAGTFTEAGKTQGNMELVCPAGKSLEVTSLTCAVSFPGAQSGTVVNQNVTTPDYWAVKTTLSMGLNYNVTKDGIGCPLVKVGSYSDGSLSGAATVGALDQLGLPTHFRVLDKI